MINSISDFLNLLLTMFQNNPLLAQLKQQLHAATPRVVGIVKAHEKGFGFLESDNKKSYFIPMSKMKKLLHGDRIEGTITIQDDKEQFEPETVLESALTHFIGKIERIDDHWVIYPHHPVIKQAIRCRIKKTITPQLKPGHWVCAILTGRPFQENNHFFSAEITEFITEDDNILRLWLTTLSRYQLPRSAPILTDAITLLPGEEIQREDLTHLPFFSIDNMETKDIDDTFFIRMTEDNHYELTVAIADPSAYIEEHSPLDKIARNRLFTCYLPDFTVPMLPVEIAEDFCSLLPDHKRAAVVCRLYINKEGCPLGKPTFQTAWIRSHAKLSYEIASDYIEQKNSYLNIHENIRSQLTLLDELTTLRMAWRKKEAILFKDKEDYKFILNEQRSVVEIVKLQRRVANHIVEEAMIAVNLALADFLATHLGYAIFNTHTGFDIKHLDNVSKLLKENDIEGYDKKRLISFEGYRDLRHALTNNTYLESRLLRYQSSADFSIMPAPHFGLGFTQYTTWTSPLRKYSDLINHRLLKAILRQTQSEQPKEDILRSLIEKRKQYRHAERDLSQALYSQFFSNKIGTCFDALVIDINKGGAKLKLIDNGSMAFMPISLIHNKRNEIESNLELGTILIQQHPLFKIADTIRVSLHEIKPDSNTFIVKYQSTV